MFYLGEAMLDIVLFAAHIKHVRDVLGRGPVGVTRRGPKAGVAQRELDTVVGQDGVDLVRHGGDQRLQEGRCRHPVGALHELDERELAGAVDRQVEVELAFSGPDLGDVDVEVADRVRLELALGRLVAIDLG